MGKSTVIEMGGVVEKMEQVGISDKDFATMSFEDIMNTMAQAYGIGDKKEKKVL